MVAWSSIIRAGVSTTPFRTLLSPQKLSTTLKNGNNMIQVRNSGGSEKMYVTPSRWQWHRVKDLFHFYLFLGLIPMTSLLLYVNIFIGPAELAPIPEGYEPKHWEYFNHPFQRFIARYIQNNPQQDYEKLCHAKFEEKEKAMLRKLQWAVEAKMRERLDYQAWYYHPAPGKYHRVMKQEFDDIPLKTGD